MAHVVYNGWKGKDGIDWAAGAAGDYKGMLVSSSYTPDPDHAAPNATGLAANEVTGGGYARQNVGGRTKTANNATNTYDHAADNLLFTNVTGDVRWLVIYKVVTDDTDHKLVCALDLGTRTLAGDNFAIKFDGGATSGIVFQGT